MRYTFDSKKHIHKLGKKSLIGTSSVVSVIAKPLTWWASGKALEPLGWTPKNIPVEDRILAVADEFNRIRKLTHRDYLTLLDFCYCNHRKDLAETAQKGINLHAELARYINDEIGSIPSSGMGKYDNRILPFINWSQNVAQFLWSEAHCYSAVLGTGGIVDAGAVLKDGRIALIDFKSSKEAYLSHFVQCAGYDIAISENGLVTSKGLSFFTLMKPIDCYIIFPFGSTPVEPKFNTLNVGDLKKGFVSAVNLYKLNRYMGEKYDC